jgi:N-acetyl-gamma-glutamyl-phosphate/LysW-gamma-L-alpha-aminoadipyl-6-phosphate reductase
MRVGIVGGSGYTGGELIRLLLMHPEVEISIITSESYKGKMVKRVHPNLRGVTDLKFSGMDDLDSNDLLFCGLPHGMTMERMPEFLEHADRVIDLSGDFRLRNPEDYQTWYGVEHTNPELLNEAVYGIPELHREEIRKARLVSGAGCLATTAILGLYPLAQEGLITGTTVIDSKVGSSATGAKSSRSTHHPERSGVVRSYKPTMHRHTAEMEQELGVDAAFSPHAVEMVRGILSTCHVFLDKPMEEKDVWGVYRSAYGDEPFIRIVKEKSGIYRYPEPKLLIGSNYCDIGFEREGRNNRLVVMSAIDNLIKGAAGQAVQCMNVMYGFEETLGLKTIGLHPI